MYYHILGDNWRWPIGLRQCTFRWFSSEGSSGKQNLGKVHSGCSFLRNNRLCQRKTWQTFRKLHFWCSDGSLDRIVRKVARWTTFTNEIITDRTRDFSRESVQHWLRRIIRADHSLPDVFQGREPYFLLHWLTGGKIDEGNGVFTYLYYKGQTSPCVTLTSFLWWQLQTIKFNFY